MRKYSISALVAAGLLAGGLTASSASAADLGGNCCADLEERIAELEATTVRKGNRKVSVTLSGWVGEQVMYWDDGVEDNVYVAGLGTTLGTHFKLTGAASISPGFTAGYVIHVEVDGSDSLTIDHDTVDGPGVYTGTRHYVQALQSYWFMKSDHLGKVSVGLQSQASDNTAILVDGSGSLVPANWVLFDVNSFKTRFSATGAFGPTMNFFGTCHGMGGAAGDCNGLTQNAVRYDSPTWHGFSVSASWGEDDFWDVAARYSGEHHGFKIAVAAAYNEVTDAVMGAQSFLTLTVIDGSAPWYDNVEFAIAPRAVDLDYFQVGAYLEHMHSGLWIYGAYGKLEADDDKFDFFDNGIFKDNTESETWYVKGGHRHRWHPLGHTVIYGEYLQTETDNNFGDNVVADVSFDNPVDPDLDIAVTSAQNSCTGTLQANGEFIASGHCVTGFDTEMEMWGLGIVQEIDAAAMSIWLKYRHFEPKLVKPGFEEGGFLCGGSANTDTEEFASNGCGLEDFEQFSIGALINF